MTYFVVPTSENKNPEKAYFYLEIELIGGIEFVYN